MRFDLSYRPTVTCREGISAVCNDIDIFLSAPCITCTTLGVLMFAAVCQLELAVSNTFECFKQLVYGVYNSHV
jgi:hypothetical protein